MIEPKHPDLSIVQQYKLLSIARSSFYVEPLGDANRTHPFKSG
jgi:putative transposase